MKHLLTILCVLTSFTALAQFPNTHTQSNPYTKEVFNGSVNPKKGLINGRYADTAAANLDYIAHEPGGQIVVGNTIYLRDTTLTKWIVAGGIGATSSTITILNDSSISICNLNFCDTFKFTNIVVNNFSVVNDSTILVCDGNNVCDTLFIPPTPISKNFVDSVKIRGGDSLIYYINGNEYLGGIVSPKSNISIISDSSIEICSYNKCDTFTFDNIVINNFTILNDSTILVCDGSNVCDTLYVTPQPFNKSFVDSAKIVNNTLYYYINGTPYSGGSIVNDSATQFQWSVIDSVNTVSSPSQGDIYLVSTSPTGIFIGHNNEIAQYDTTAGFTYSTASVGDLLYNAALQTVSKWTGTQWNRIVTNNYVHILYEETIIGKKSFADTLNLLSKPIQILTQANVPVELLHTRATGVVYPWLSIRGDQSGSKITMGANNPASAADMLRIISNYTDTIWTGTYRPLHLDVYDYLDLRGSRGSGTSDSAIRFRIGNSYAGVIHKNLQWSLNGYLSRNFYHNDTAAWKPLVIDAAGNVGQGSWVGVGGGGGGSVSWGSITGSLSDQTDLLDSLNNKINKTDRFSIGVIKPILALNDSTLAFDSLNLTEIRYSQAARDTSNWKDSTLIDKKYLNDRIAGISGGSMPANYVDTTSQPNDSTIRIHFAQGNYVDYIIRTSATIDTSHLSDRINTNAANIATNTSAIAANTTAIAGKADKATTLTINGETHDISTNQTWTISTGSGGSGGSADSLKKLPVDTSANVTGNLLAFDATTHKWYLTTPPAGIDTSFIKIQANGLYNGYNANKGLKLQNTTVDGTTAQNSPAIVFRGGQNGNPYWYRMLADQWNFVIKYSSDSINYNTGMSMDRLGAVTFSSSINTSSYVLAAQFAAGTKFNVVGSSGQMQIGSNVINPRTTLILYDTAKGFVSNRGTTTAARRVTSNIYTGAITNGGTGYTNVSNSPRTFTAISGYAPDFSANVTIAGGVLTSFGIVTPMYGARVGDTYTCSNCGTGSGMVVTVTALTGDTARGLQYYDSSLNQLLVWNGQAYSHEVDYLSNSTYSLLHGPDYIFTGTTATWTLPAVTTSHVGDGNSISIMNMGTGSITLNSDAGNTIVPTGTTTPTNTITITAGSTVKLFPTGTYFKVLFNN